MIKIAAGFIDLAEQFMENVTKPMYFFFFRQSKRIHQQVGSLIQSTPVEVQAPQALPYISSSLTPLRWFIAIASLI